MGVCMAWNSRDRKHRFHWLAAGLVVLLITTGAGPSLAGAPGPRLAKDSDREAKQEAKARFSTGLSHYNLNEFDQALREFKEAYRLYPDPVFLYNLGQCERQLGHNEEAIRFYRSYLREQQKAPNREDVLNKIAELEAALKNAPPEPEKPAAVAPMTPPPTTTPPAPRPDSTAATTPPPSQPEATQELPATPPVNSEVATGSETDTPAGVDLTATSEPQSEATPQPIYKRWWFWTAAAAVVVGASIGIYAAASGDGPTAPSSDLGSQKVF
jgi:tetratricopeptide (TPR) repeat protein